MKMAIDVYGYGRGGKYVCMFAYTYAGFRIISMQIEKEERHMSRVMHITRAPCQRYVWNSQEKKKENKEVVMNTKIPAKKWGDTEIAERGRSVLVMRARYRSAGLTPHQRGWTDAG